MAKTKFAPSRRGVFSVRRRSASTQGRKRSSRSPDRPTAEESSLPMASFRRSRTCSLPQKILRAASRSRLRRERRNSADGGRTAKACASRVARSPNGRRHAARRAPQLTDSVPSVWMSRCFCRRKRHQRRRRANVHAAPPCPRVTQGRPSSWARSASQLSRRQTMSGAQRPASRMPRARASACSCSARASPGSSPCGTAEDEGADAAGPSPPRLASGDCKATMSTRIRTAYPWQACARAERP